MGDTPADRSRSLKLTSQLDCNDAGRGYGPYEEAGDVSFDRVTGQVCGHVSHFSLGVVTIEPVSATPVVAKGFNMGGLCPGLCSAHGYCREDGRCVCFAGFAGLDCASRACPFDVSWDAVSGVAHAQTVCSNRGVCNPATGACECYDGYEGAACQRQACPSGCSGHGSCRLLSELGAVRRGGGYASWAADRIQVCACDGGYGGPDCSERTCPRGDDPETACLSAGGHQVQSVTLDFGGFPPSLGGSYPAATLAGDDLALLFTAADGSVVSTPRVRHALDPAAGAPGLEAALRGLPGGVVSDVLVTGSAPTPSSVRYDVTFAGRSQAVGAAGAAASVAANTVPGNQALLRCPFNRDGASMGCVAPGCRPVVSQLRLLALPPTSGGVAFNASSLLLQPPPLAPGDDAVPARWGVTVTLIVSAPAGNPNRLVYRAASAVYEAGAGGSQPDTPLPPPGRLRRGVPLLYGLAVDFDDADAAVTPGAYAFSWRLPTCAVAQTASADADVEAAECSARGQCDRGTGECRCFAGYDGYSCSQQTAVV